MHREALADLGTSLRRELGDLLEGGPAALADLEEDARRWLGTMDGEMQALAAWLTSSSIWADLPVDTPPAPDTLPRGVKEREVLPSPDRISDADDARRAMERPAEGSSAGLGMSPPVRREEPSQHRRDSRPPGGVLPAVGRSAPDPREESSRPSGVVLPAVGKSAPGLREKSSRPSGGALPASGAVLLNLGRSAPDLGSSAPDPGSSAPGPREESSQPSGVVLPASGAVLPNLGSGAPDLWEESSRPSGGVLPALGKSSPGLWEEALEARHRSDGASTPPEPAVPLQPLLTDAFTPARSLHDLARLLSSGERSDEVASPRNRLKSAGGLGAPPTVETPRGASPSPDVPTAPALPAAYPDVPYPDVPAASRRFLEVNAAAGDAPRGVSTVGTISSGPEGALGAKSAPGEAGIFPSLTAGQTPEVDVEPILDALARSVAEEYRRFYGS